MAVLRFLLPIAGFALGCAIGVAAWTWGFRPPLQYADYLGLATLAGLDSVLGGVRSGLEGRFQNLVFVTGLIFNVLLAALLAWFGTRIGVQLSLAVAVALGGRIFLNLSIIRRQALTRLTAEGAEASKAEVAHAQE